MERIINTEHIMLQKALKKSDIDKWKKYTYYYLTPHIRSSNDKFQTYFWYAKGGEMHIDDLEIIKYIPK